MKSDHKWELAELYFVIPKDIDAVKEVITNWLKNRELFNKGKVTKLGGGYG